MKQPAIHPILQASALCFSYSNCTLFTDLSIAILPGVTLVRGGDGRGKSTLLKVMAGVLPAQSGRLHIDGIDLHAQAEKYKAQVLWIDSRSAAFDQLTVLDYLELKRKSHANFDDAMLADLTFGLGLQDHLHKQLFMLSTGSKRKVFLTAAFASSALITLLDEPFAALDAISIEFIVAWLQGAQDKLQRAWVIADYVAPVGLQLSQVIDLGD